jgi:hypothetical protein
MRRGLAMSIASAIENRHLLAFEYDGRPRVVEPHVYGVNSKGHEALSAYQVWGGSASGEAIGWKMFRVEHMRHIGELPATFCGPRQDYNPHDPSFASVHARL